MQSPDSVERRVPLSMTSAGAFPMSDSGVGPLEQNAKDTLTRRSYFRSAPFTSRITRSVLP